MKRFARCIALLFLLPLLLPPGLLAQEADGVVVLFAPGVDAAKFVEGYRSQTHPELRLAPPRLLGPLMNIYLLQAREGEAVWEELARELAARPEVRAAEPNLELQTRDTLPNDSLFALQWGMQRIQAPDVWSFATGGQSAEGDEIVVAVFDRGFDVEHPDLVENLWHNPAEIPGNLQDDDQNGKVDDVLGWNFVNNSPTHLVEAHGTSVAGIIGARGNNGAGVAGVNWRVKLLLCTVKTTGHIAAAMDYVLQQRLRYNQSGGAEGAFVVATNASLGIPEKFCDENSVWGAMFDPLGQAGILNVGATANENINVDERGDLPTTCDSEFLVTVTNVTREDRKAPDAAYGPTFIDLGAPGDGTPSTALLGGYDLSFGGTSAATPHVAGAAALLYALPCSELPRLALEDPPAAARLTRDALLFGAEPLPDLQGKTATGGLLNLFNSMNYIHGFCIAREEERAANSFSQTYLEDKAVVRVYPNPFSSEIWVDYSTPRFSTLVVEVFNALGQKILEQRADTQPFTPQTLHLDQVAHWARGVYFITVRDGTKKHTLRFVKGK